uniref:Coiled-coil domain-containing protein 43 n=1 Tax=Tetraodon nigroviridis TaxID=99883 RepID=H3D2B0_TETNG
IERPQRAKMAAPMTDTGEFESWLNDRLDSLEVDRDVYGTYILGVLQEEETDEEKEDALKGILSAFVDEDTLEDVCTQIIKRWTEWNQQYRDLRVFSGNTLYCIVRLLSASCPLLRVPALFKNTNVEEVLKRNQQRRVQAREDAQKKKEMDKMQREKDKLAKQDRKEKEKKRTQKGERKR